MSDVTLPPVVVLSTADFDAPVWTNKQHLAVGLARHTPVTYVESFGLRAPRLTTADLRRLGRRLRASPASRRDARPSTGDVRVVSPRVLPLHDSRAARRANAVLAGRLPLPELADSVLWTFSPVTYGLESRARAVVYHAVDLLHAQPRVAARAILEGERRLVDRADAVIASSTGVRDHLRALGRDDVLLWQNVADTELFASARPQRRPRAVFAGNLTTTKIDTGLLHALVDAGVELVVAGPVGIDGADADGSFDGLLGRDGVEYVGNLAPRALADLLATCTVGLVPYRLNDYTAGVFPMKVYEYLAAGLSVVSTPLPSLRHLDEPGLVLAQDAELVGAVRRAVGDVDEVAAADRRRRASDHSWTRRTGEAQDLLRDLVP
ncbi:glycosyltransferase [Cellulomonas septica]|uniref:Glycosyltransferase family 1 protein n=1 Tax=Cellulomonas septica TaxID=285080 RepID=A0ABX1JYQ8_9CELL|nr:glycosyltransferase [Cellulomonas septica]NKY39473.1 glycosyltransferase family 1 protein [Cellulomonas septica]